MITIITCYYFVCLLSSYDFSTDGFTTAGGLARKKSDMSTKEWNRKLAFRCRRIKDIYTRQSANLTGKYISALVQKLVIRYVYQYCPNLLVK